MSVHTAATGSHGPRLQRRLMQAFAGFTLGVVVVLGGLGIVFVYAVEDEFFAASLQAELTRQQQHRATHGVYTAPSLPTVRLHAQGQGLPADLAPQLLRHPHRTEFSGEQGRHYHVRRIDAEGTLLVAEVSAALVVRPMRQELLAWLLGAAGGVTLLSLGMGAWLSRRISAPLTGLAARVASSAPTALPQQLAQGMDDDEVGQLARHLDHLHARVREFIDRERAFTADVSHELRTPLAVLQVATERLQAHVPGAQQPLLRSIQLALWQLGQTVDALLALARETPAEPGVGTEQPLLPVLERVVLAHAPLLDAERVELSLHVPPSITRPWPPVITHLLVSNLLGNAIAHASAPQIVIEADRDALRVSNPSLPWPEAASRDGAQAPLTSAEGARTATSAGLGLGLSIARRLAERHGLTVSLQQCPGQTSAIVHRQGMAAPLAPPG